ncbi:two-component response regulator-like APRR7 isoform X2 [Telopea speciosissima]|uniref:two-component response regulator-like APRR7 isoform X2 n=1 Tax=Telopea speciosissima TaxID=54955 RepID=UPI001CC5BCCB|nr:two-component response regulator-like APRR7 isoform X2 [Telopea speciosissima]
MGSVSLNNDTTGTKRLTELINHVHEIRDGIVGEGQGLSKEGASRVNEVAEDINGHEGAIQAQAVVRKPQQQPQGPVVSWERFLPLRSLKVLLVENDDSTRHVVSALLRNCGYEVTTASNSLQAWKVLQDLTNHIDLVLTEVVMPYFSGIGLLCKIMSHKTCKNIPVIMMSSHDSMGIVFKCLSKGAVDFLVKPIRKNELKNLWQHVWRRCHSSSDSGSGIESGTQTKKSAKSKSVEESDNNTGSNDEDDSSSIGLNGRDGSDNGSGTQSSWTKRAVEVDSPQPMSLWNQIADPTGSTCAQIIHPKIEAFGNEWPVTAKRDCKEEDGQLDCVAMGKDLEIGVPRNSDLQLEYPSEKISTNFAGTKQDISPVLERKKDSEKIHKGLLALTSEKPIGKMRSQDAELMAIFAISTNHQVETGVSEVPNRLSMIPDIRDKTVSDSVELPSLELSLKRVKGVGYVGTATDDERNILRHSDLSAFSRYNNASTANQAPNGNLGSCSPLGNSSETPKTESMQNFHSNGTLPNHQSNGYSNNNDMGSTTKNAFTKPAIFNDKFVSTSTAKSLHSSALQPVQNGHLCPPQKAIPKKANDGAATVVQTEPKGSNQQIQIQHHHYHYHHYHHHLHNLEPQQPPDHDDSSFKNMAAAGPQCGSSNVSDGPIEGNTGNCSLNGSASGSNHGSNGQNGSSTAMNTGGIKMESDNMIAEKSGSGGGSGSGSRIGVDQNRFAQRVAVLTKFRQKRKERCFEKKVRYQNRKRLAEQRPRVRGQFVRQAVSEQTICDTDC